MDERYSLNANTSRRTPHRNFPFDLLAIRSMSPLVVLVLSIQGHPEIILIVNAHVKPYMNCVQYNRYISTQPRLVPELRIGQLQTLFAMLVSIWRQGRCDIRIR